MQSRTVRRLTLGAGVAVGGGVLAFLFMSAPAHADDGTQSPGGALGGVVEVVDQVLTEPAKAEPEPEPTKEPEAPAEPEQESEPAQHDDTPAEAPAEPEPDTTEPAPPATPIDDVVDEALPVPTIPTPVTAPVVVPVPTVPAPVVTPAPTQPAPFDQPDTTELPAEQQPTVPAVEVVDLPAVDPVVGSGTMLPGLPPWTASPEQPAPAPQCTSDQDDEATPDHGRGVVRTITDRRTGAPLADRKPAPVKPCPTPAGPDGQAATVGTVKPPPPTGEQLVAITANGAYSAPVLHRLHQLRARGDIPVSRTEHPEPGPA